MQKTPFFVKKWKLLNSNFPCIQCKKLIPQGTKHVWLCTSVPEAAEQIMKRGRTKTEKSE